MKKTMLIFLYVLSMSFSCKNDDEVNFSESYEDLIIGNWATQKVGSVIENEEVFDIFYDWSDEPCGLTYDMEIWSDGTLIGYRCPIINEPYYTTTWSLNGNTLILGDNITTIKELNSEFLKTYRIMLSGETQVKVYKRVN